MRVMFLIKQVTEDGACSNLHKTNAEASVRLYPNMCVASCQFSFALSESFCLAISSFCYSDLLGQVSGDGSPSCQRCMLAAPSSGDPCSSDTVFPVQFWGWWWDLSGSGTSGLEGRQLLSPCSTLRYVALQTASLRLTWAFLKTSKKPQRPVLPSMSPLVVVVMHAENQVSPEVMCVVC